MNNQIMDDLVIHTPLSPNEYRDSKSGEEFSFSYYFSLDQLAENEETLQLIVSRINCDRFSVYLNDSLIDMAGTPGYQSNIWNNNHLFTLPDTLLQEENIIRIDGVNYQRIEPEDCNVYIGPASRAMSFYNTLIQIYDKSYTLFIGFMLGLSFIILILYLNLSARNILFLIFPISAILFSIYLMDYVPLYDILIPKIVLRKITTTSLALTMAAVSFAVTHLTGRKIVRILSVGTAALFIILSVAINDLAIYRIGYHILNLLFPVNFIIWGIFSFIERKKSPSVRILFALVTLVFSATLVDVITMLLAITDFKISIFIMVFVLISLQLITISELIESEKHIYNKNQLLKKQQTILEKALQIDEVSRLFNQRYLQDVMMKQIIESQMEYGIILLELTNLNLINKTMGFKNGDYIIRRTSSIIEKNMPDRERIFRYSGPQFILIIPKTNELSCFEIAENIRRAVISSANIMEKAGRIPISISAGISYLKKDAQDFNSLVEKAEQALILARKKGSNLTLVYSPETPRMLEAGQSNFIKNDMLMDFVLSLANAIDAKDPYTGYHSQEVSRYSLLIAEAMNLSDEKKYYLRLGGMLHDVGKLGIPDRILLKPGKLTDDEFKHIQSHTTIGFNIANQIFRDSEIINCVRNHHERWDGSGYPDQLKGENIPLLGRIISVADAYHAMVSNRVYRDGTGKDFAINQLISNSGKQFDPEIVSAFLKCVL